VNREFHSTDVAYNTDQKGRQNYDNGEAGESAALFLASSCCWWVGNSRAGRAGPLGILRHRYARGEGDREKSQRPRDEPQN
jgi:hypothetical protein